MWADRWRLNMMMAMHESKTAATTPTPIPALAPVERLEELSSSTGSNLVGAGAYGVDEVGPILTGVGVATTFRPEVNG
jgi:hypothetical protein